MGSKAKGKARNKATKRSGVANAAAAASSAAAAAASHVSKDIQADANMGVPATPTAPAAPHASTESPASEQDAKPSGPVVKDDASSGPVTNENSFAAATSVDAAAGSPAQADIESRQDTVAGASPEAASETDPASSSSTGQESKADAVEQHSAETPASKSGAAKHSLSGLNSNADSDADSATEKSAAAPGGEPTLSEQALERGSVGDHESAPASKPTGSEAKPDRALGANAPPAAQVPPISGYESSSAAISPKTVDVSSRVPEAEKIDTKESKFSAPAVEPTTQPIEGTLPKSGQKAQDLKRDDPRAGELKVEDQQNEVLNAVERENKALEHAKASGASEENKACPPASFLETQKRSRKSREEAADAPVSDYSTDPQDEFYASITAAVSDGKLASGSLEKAKIVSNDKIDPLAQHTTESASSRDNGSETKSREEEEYPFNEADAESRQTVKAPVAEAHQLADLKSPPPQSKSEKTHEVAGQASPDEERKPEVKDAALATEVSETMNNRPLSPTQKLPQDVEGADARSDSRAAREAYWATENDAAPDDDDFYKSLSAAGLEAQRNSSGVRHEQVGTDQSELDSELERAQEQEDAFDRVVAARRARDAELNEENHELRDFEEAVAEGVADVEEDDFEAREAEAVARREARLAEELRKEVRNELPRHEEVASPDGDDLPPQSQGVDDKDDHYGALSSNAFVRDRSDSNIAPDELPVESAIDDQASTSSSLHAEQLSIEGDAFYRSLSSGGPPRSPSGRLQTEDLGEDRVNSDFDGIIGKTESIRGGSSSVASSPAPTDDFYAFLGSEPQPPQPAPPPIELNLELDDDFLDDDETGELDANTPQAVSFENSVSLESAAKPEVSLSFLESDDDLLPDEEAQDGEAQDSEQASLQPVNPVEGPSEQDQPAPTTNAVEPAPQQLRPRPSMTQFHTDKQGFDLPLEILPQPVKRHAPQRVGSRAGTPRGPAALPHAPTRPLASGVAREAPDLINSPPRAAPVPPPRAAPSRVPPRPASGGATSKYRPSGAAFAEPPNPVHQESPLTPRHDIFANEAAPQHPRLVGAPTQQGVPPPAAVGRAPSSVVPPPAQSQAEPRPIAPRPPANPDPYGFPGLQSNVGRRAPARASNPGSRRVSSSGAPGVASAQTYRQGVAQGIMAPPSAAAPPPHLNSAASAPPLAPVAAMPPPTRGAAYAGGMTPTPGSPPDNISPRTVQTQHAPGALGGASGAHRAGSLGAFAPPPSAPPSMAPPTSIQPNLNGSGQQYAQFGAPLRPPSAPQRTDSRSRYTPSPLNAPVSLAHPPRGGNPEEELLNRQRALFFWAPRGWVQVVPENQFGTNSARVHTGDIKSLEIVSPTVLAKFPLPVVNAKGAIKTKRKDLEKWVDGLVSENRPGSLLYSILKELLGPEEGHGSGIRDVLKRYTVPTRAPDRHAAPIGPESPSAPQPDILAMLRDGDRDGAMQAALDAKNYAHALIIAHALGGAHWQIALNEFVAEEVRKRDPQLAFVYRALGAGDAASGAAALGELMPRGQTELVDYAQIDTILERWADAAAALYGGGGAAHAALAEMGSLLVDRGKVEEGHACFVLVGAALGTPKFRLPLVSEKGSPGFDSYVLAELYEFVLGKTLPALVPFKVAFAGLLADSGYEAEALRVAENASALSKALKAPPKLAEQAARMATRCSSVSSTQGTWLQRKLSRPNLEKTWVSSFNKFVSGDDEEPQVPRPQSAGLATMTEAVPQRQSYTPGPYSSLEPYQASVNDNGFVGADTSRIQTPLRPEPINEVDENQWLGAAPSNSVSPSFASPYHPQYGQFQQPAIQQQLQQQGPSAHASLDAAYSQRPASQGSYAPGIAASNVPYAPTFSREQQQDQQPPRAGGTYQDQAVHPLNNEAGLPPPMGPYAQQAYPQTSYPPQGFPQGGSYTPLRASSTSGGQYAPPPTAAQVGGLYAPPAAPTDTPDPLQHGQLAVQAPSPYVPERPQQSDLAASLPPSQGGRYAPASAVAPQAQASTSDALLSEKPALQEVEEQKVESESKAEPKKEEEPPKKKGWLSWLKKEDPNAQKPYKVKLGSEAKLIYDKESKRWYKEGEPKPEPKKGPPPPPKVASHKVAAAPAAPASAPAQALPPSPAAPAVPSGPGKTIPGETPSPGPIPPSAAPSAALAPPSAGDVPTPPVTGGIDGILAASASAGAARKKRQPRSRYVSVTQSGLPEGMAQ